MTQGGIVQLRRNIAVIPMQDYLELDSGARINIHKHWAATGNDAWINESFGS